MAFGQSQECRVTRQIDLELLECKPFKNGCVFVKYRVKA